MLTVPPVALPTQAMLSSLLALSTSLSLASSDALGIVKVASSIAPVTISPCADGASLTAAITIVVVTAFDSKPPGSLTQYVNVAVPLKFAVGTNETLPLAFKVAVPPVPDCTRESVRVACALSTSLSFCNSAAAVMMSAVSSVPLTISPAATGASFTAAKLIVVVAVREPPAPSLTV